MKIGRRTSPRLAVKKTLDSTLQKAHCKGPTTAEKVLGGVASELVDANADLVHANADLEVANSELLEKVLVHDERVGQLEKQLKMVEADRDGKAGLVVELAARLEELDAALQDTEKRLDAEVRDTEVDA